MTPTVIFLGPESHLPQVCSRLSSFEVRHCSTGEEVDARLDSADVVFDAYMKIPFPPERLERAKALKLFITATTGATHIATHELEQRGIPLLTLKGQEHVTRNITAAAELSWLLLMSVARPFRAAIQEPLDGDWDRNKFPGTMLRGRTLGIIGCGRIGTWVSRYANAFEMRVLGYDPLVASPADTITPVDLDSLLAESDAVTVHVNYTEASRNLLNRDRIFKIKRGAILVNTSRGELIDEAALLDALESGHLSGAGLDVLQGEPDIADHPLVRYARTHQNLVITPHIGGFSPDALRVVLDFSCERIRQFFGQPVQAAGPALQ
jgi:D-3-phosphoglycerate dehydrogenase